MAIDREVADADGMLRGLDALAEASTAVQVVDEVERETSFTGSRETTRTSEAGISVAHGVPVASGKLSASHRRSATATGRLCRTGVEHHQVIFGPVDRALDRITAALASARVWLLPGRMEQRPPRPATPAGGPVTPQRPPHRGITVKMAGRVGSSTDGKTPTRLRASVPRGGTMS